MKHFFTILLVFATTFTFYSQSLDYTNLALLFSKNDNNGTARFTGMSGAFGALGGDISSININPAGIAVYNNSVFSGSLNSRNTAITSDYYNNKVTSQENYDQLSQAGAVFVFDSAYNSKWSKFALGINYRITKDFNNRFIAEGNSGLATFNQFPLDNNTNPIAYNTAEKQRFSNQIDGDLSEINVAFSSVHENKLYVGAGFSTYDLNFNQRSTLTENNIDDNNNTLTANLYQENTTLGTGISLNAGFIYKFNSRFRFGLAYQSPTWFSEITETTNILKNEGSRLGDLPFLGDTEITTSNDITAIYDNTSGNYFPTQNLIYQLNTPSRLTASTAFVFGKKGLISLDYSKKGFSRIRIPSINFNSENQFFQNNLRNTHNLNIGTEWRFERLSLRGGYKFEQNPFKNAAKINNTEGYSIGGGYNFGNSKFDISYSDSNHNDTYNFYSQYNNVNPAKLAFSNKVVTATFTFNL